MLSTSYARNTIYTCTVMPVSILMAAPNIIPDILINLYRTKVTFAVKQVKV
jgi:hypothetical protein